MSRFPVPLAVAISLNPAPVPGICAPGSDANWMWEPLGAGLADRGADAGVAEAVHAETDTNAMIAMRMPTITLARRALPPGPDRPGELAMSGSRLRGPSSTAGRPDGWWA